MNHNFGFVLLDLQLFSLELAGLKSAEYSSLSLKLQFGLKLSHLLYVYPQSLNTPWFPTLVRAGIYFQDLKASHLTKTNK